MADEYWVIKHYTPEQDWQVQSDTSETTQQLKLPWVCKKKRRAHCILGQAQLYPFTGCLAHCCQIV